MPKKKVFAARNLKTADQIYHSKEEKQKKKIIVFLSRQFCASLKIRLTVRPPAFASLHFFFSSIPFYSLRRKKDGFAHILVASVLKAHVETLRGLVYTAE